MKTNTKIQRRAVYNKLLKEYQQDLKNYPQYYWEFNITVGLCSKIIDIINNYSFMTYLPELATQKPKRMYSNTAYWWNRTHKSGITRRIKALEDAIKLTYL